MTPQQLLMYLISHGEDEPINPAESDNLSPIELARIYSDRQRVNQYIPFEDQTRQMQWLIRNNPNVTPEYSDIRTAEDWRADKLRDYQSGQRDSIDRDPYWDTRNKDPYTLTGVPGGRVQVPLDYQPPYRPGPPRESIEPSEPTIGQQMEGDRNFGVPTNIGEYMEEGDSTIFGGIHGARSVDPNDEEPSRPINPADLPWYLPPDVYVNQRTGPRFRDEHQWIDVMDRRISDADETREQSEPWFPNLFPSKEINLMSQGTLTPGGPPIRREGWDDPPDIPDWVNPGINRDRGRNPRGLNRGSNPSGLSNIGIRKAAKNRLLKPGG